MSSADRRWTNVSTVPAHHGVALAVRHGGDAVERVRSECDEQALLGLEREPEGLAARIVEQPIERQGAAAITILHGFVGEAFRKITTETCRSRLAPGAPWSALLSLCGR